MLRKRGNTLFTDSNVSDEALAGARADDDRELSAFAESYGEILKTIAELSGNVDSQVILDIKDRVDRLYEQSCGLGGDRESEKQGLARLYQAITQAIRDGAAHDAEAMKKLDEEALAHEVHWQLMQQPVVADLLFPDSPITPRDLVPTLLSEDATGFSKAMEIFRDEHRILILRQARKLLAEHKQGAALKNARARLHYLEQLVEQNGKTS